MRGSGVWGGCEAETSGEPVWSARSWTKTIPVCSSCWYVPDGGAADERALGAGAQAAGGGLVANPLSLLRSAPVARVAASPARDQGGLLSGGLLPGQPQLQSSERGDLPSCFPPSLIPTMTGLQIGGGKEAPAEGGLRARQEAQTISSDEIDRLAAGAIAGLGAGKGDVSFFSSHHTI